MFKAVCFTACSCCIKTLSALWPVLLYGHAVVSLTPFSLVFSRQRFITSQVGSSLKPSLFGVSFFTPLDFSSSVGDHVTAWCCLFASGFHSVSGQRADLNDKAEPDERGYAEA